MDAKKRQTVTLGVLVAVLVAILAFQFWPSAQQGAAPAGARRQGRTPANAASGKTAPGAQPPSHVPQVVEVEVARLEQEPPAVDDTGRNPFRFRPKAPPPRPQTPPPAAGGADPALPPGTPPPAPPPPPIALKFIGTVSGNASTGKVAVLSDGKFVYYGREGDIIEGRYRVVKIGEESVQMEYLDGRGRQTIRLSGA
jgi:hypothetical protein